MSDYEFSVSLKCLFCGCELKDDDKQEHRSGDLIKCHLCGELNDFDSCVDVAKNEGYEKAKALAELKIKSAISKIFKK